jgi:hypothetical protein
MKKTLQTGAPLDSATALKAAIRVVNMHLVRIFANRERLILSSVNT